MKYTGGNMKHATRPRNSIMVLVGVLALISLSVNTSGCARAVFMAPTPLQIEKAPQPMTVATIEKDYSVDSDAANALYAGQSFYFKQVKVDIANRIGNAARATEDSVIVGKIKFVPTFPSDMEGITEGAMIDVIGRVQGYLWGYVVITDCWISLTAIGGPPPPMY